MQVIIVLSLRSVIDMTAKLLEATVQGEVQGCGPAGALANPERWVEMLVLSDGWGWA